MLHCHTCGRCPHECTRCGAPGISLTGTWRYSGKFGFSSNLPHSFPTARARSPASRDLNIMQLDPRSLAYFHRCRAFHAQYMSHVPVHHSFITQAWSVDALCRARQVQIPRSLCKHSLFFEHSAAQEHPFAALPIFWISMGVPAPGSDRAGVG